MATETALGGVDNPIFRGEDISLNFTVSPTTDITGWTLVFTVARRQNSTTKLIAKSCSIISAEAGTFRAIIEDTDTDDIEPAEYFWDVWRTDAGYERLVGFGTFTISANARIPPSA